MHMVKATELATMKCTVSNWSSLKLLMQQNGIYQLPLKSSQEMEIVVKCLGESHQFRKCQK